MQCVSLANVRQSELRRNCRCPPGVGRRPDRRRGRRAEGALSQAVRAARRRIRPAPEISGASVALARGLPSASHRRFGRAVTRVAVAARSRHAKAPSSQPEPKTSKTRDHRTLRHRLSDHPGRHASRRVRGAGGGRLQRRWPRHHYRPDPAVAGGSGCRNPALPRDDRQAVRREPHLPADRHVPRLSRLYPGDRRRRRQDRRNGR